MVSSSFQLARLFVPELKELLEKRNFKEIKNILKSISLPDLADVWAEFSRNEQTLLFRLLSGRNATLLFQELDPEDQNHILNSLANKELEGLLDDFDPEEAVRIFYELPEKSVRHLYSLLEKEQKKEVDQILKYPDNSVGSWMRIQLVELTPNLSTAQAMQRIRQANRLRKGDGQDGYYVTDKNKKVVGVVYLRELISAPSNMKLSQYISPVRFLRLDPNQDQEEAIHLFTKYKPSMAPVMDSDNRLLGIIDAEDIIPLVEEEVTEDIAKMAGTGSEELESESIWSKMKIRFPWLIATCIGQVLVALLIFRFDFVLSRVLALASFLPFIIAMGGNVGSQSSMILVRALAIQEYDISDQWKILLKETAIGFFLGVVYGFIIGGMALVIYGGQFGPLFPVVIGLATVVSMTVATLTGVLGPLSLVRVGVDPATATGPIITTMTDIVGTAIYFLLAMWLLL
ncbi:magnesium transporter [bacterium F11]|nr:magnesium transporter [bacterium F11]